MCSRGLSPRVRGNHRRRSRWSGGRGSIPARAGEPPSPPRAPAPLRVYPRACGGTSARVWRQWLVRGLSPRVRGNPFASSATPKPGGSIPARAGEPMAFVLDGNGAGVYPRACGGTAILRTVSDHELGLSPRVRGNRRHGVRRQRGRGSIPARAGEPCPENGEPSNPKVYPRACGGTTEWDNVDKQKRGLSPRVRGNHVELKEVLLATGSIPARAGEPPAWSRGFRRSAVYPRACGGTLVNRVRSGQIRGLSPRVRGNRLHHRLQVEGDQRGRGLSPRVRGNPLIR